MYFLDKKGNWPARATLNRECYRGDRMIRLRLCATSRAVCYAFSPIEHSVRQCSNLVVASPEGLHAATKPTEAAGPWGRECPWGRRQPRRLPLAKTRQESRSRRLSMKKRQVCDHCGGRFGLVTYRWWSSKFCKRRCKSAYLRELASARGQIRVGTASISPTAFMRRSMRWGAAPSPSR